jgi:3D (Asp-Asp-Asp) domain-containing protein
MNLLATALLSVSPFVFAKTPVVTPPIRETSGFVSAPVIIGMESVFSEKEVVESSEIAYQTEYVEKKEEEYGNELILKEGKTGTSQRYFRLTLWRGEEIAREFIREEIEPPVSEVISRGTKIVWRDLPTPEDGVLGYWYKLSSTSTAYTPFCPGCSGKTYTGSIAGRGSCAVDPSVIKLGTKLYIPGYGICIAEDTGGAIGGKEIDVCFPDKETAVRWGRRSAEVYLLTKSP